MNIRKIGRYFILCFLPYNIEIILPIDYYRQIGNKYFVKFNLNFSLKKTFSFYQISYDHI